MRLCGEPGAVGERWKLTSANKWTARNSWFPARKPKRRQGFLLLLPWRSPTFHHISVLYPWCWRLLKPLTVCAVLGSDRFFRFYYSAAWPWKRRSTVTACWQTGNYDAMLSQKYIWSYEILCYYSKFWKFATYQLSNVALALKFLEDAHVYNFLRNCKDIILDIVHFVMASKITG